MTLLNIAFIADIIADIGFWGLSLCCMSPMIGFTAYVAGGPKAMAAILTVWTGLLMLMIPWSAFASVSAVTLVAVLLPASSGFFAFLLDFLTNQLPKSRAT